MSSESKLFHQRLRRKRGNAKQHKCVRCGGQAFEWAYQHTDPEPLVDEQGCFYSLNPDCYAPMCRSCHRKLDYSVNLVSREALAARLRALPRDSAEMARRGRLGNAERYRKG